MDTNRFGWYTIATKGSIKMKSDYTTVTEVSGDEVSQEQIQRLCNRYYWAEQYCAGKDVLEVACGSGQAFGLLQRVSKTFEAGDTSEELLAVAKRHYGERVNVQKIDAHQMPFGDRSKEVILCFEAIYYLEDVAKFLGECRRILRPGGLLLIASANKDLYDFNPSPYSHTYFGVVEMRDLFSRFGFGTEFFGDTPLQDLSIRQRILRPIKKLVVQLSLVPKSMSGKKMLKRLVFGNLVPMPAEITDETCPRIDPDPISSDVPNTSHKVIFCKATLTSP
ncbi:MAG: putative methyltransferase [Deltaproteobacteria bacterium]|jgi:ubiquinone/menaquinone biosynthesis C-methylase UbiE|nr:putative methyltransferase [Deltaproteobacteria bacterium]